MNNGKVRRRRKALLHIYVDRCSYCECALTDDNRTIDHVLPISRGGGDELANLALACDPCNKKKANRTPEEAGMKLYRVRRLETATL